MTKVAPKVKTVERTHRVNNVLVTRTRTLTGRKVTAETYQSYLDSQLLVEPEGRPVSEVLAEITAAAAKFTNPVFVRVEDLYTKTFEGYRIAGWVPSDPEDIEAFEELAAELDAEAAALKAKADKKKAALKAAADKKKAAEDKRIAKMVAAEVARLTKKD